MVDSQGTKKPSRNSENAPLETNPANFTQVTYTLEPAGYGNLISERREDNAIPARPPGSTRMLTSSAGASTDTYNFKAFGDHYSFSGSTTNSFRWVGRLGIITMSIDWRII